MNRRGLQDLAADLGLSARPDLSEVERLLGVDASAIAGPVSLADRAQLASFGSNAAAALHYALRVPADAPGAALPWLAGGSRVALPFLLNDADEGDDWWLTSVKTLGVRSYLHPHDANATVLELRGRYLVIRTLQHVLSLVVARSLGVGPLGILVDTTASSLVLARRGIEGARPPASITLGERQFEISVTSRPVSRPMASPGARRADRRSHELAADVGDRADPFERLRAIDVAELAAVGANVSLLDWPELDEWLVESGPHWSVPLRVVADASANTGAAIWRRRLNELHGAVVCRGDGTSTGSVINDARGPLPVDAIHRLERFFRWDIPCIVARSSPDVAVLHAICDDLVLLGSEEGIVASTHAIEDGLAAHIGGDYGLTFGCAEIATGDTPRLMAARALEDLERRRSAR